MDLIFLRQTETFDLSMVRNRDLDSWQEVIKYYIYVKAKAS